MKTVQYARKIRFSLGKPKEMYETRFGQTFQKKRFGQTFQKKPATEFRLKSVSHIDFPSDYLSLSLGFPSGMVFCEQR